MEDGKLLLILAQVQLLTIKELELLQIFQFLENIHLIQEVLMMVHQMVLRSMQTVTMLIIHRLIMLVVLIYIHTIYP